MIKETVIIKCPDCGNDVICDKYECSCIFGKCPNCLLDIEIDNNCQERG